MNSLSLQAPRRRRFGLRSEVGLLVAVVSVLGSATAGFLTYRQMSQLTYEAGLEHGKAVLDALAAPAAVAIATNDLAKLDSFVAELVSARSTDMLYVVVVDHQGGLLATSETGMVGVQADLFETGFTESALASGDFYFVFGPQGEAPRYLDLSRAVVLGERWGTLMARVSLNSFTTQLDSLKRTIIAVCILAAVFGWLLVVALLERLVVRPVGELAEMARRLGEGELDVRVTQRRSDEIGDLNRSLNTMARRLFQYTTGLEDAVRERTADLQAANMELERLATTDGLTNLKNHRFFQDALSTEIKRAERMDHPLALLMIDIDYFKKFNDTHGHPAGDEVLRAVAWELRNRLRSTDVLARYGGEEFAAILINTDAEQGAQTAREVCEVVRKANFDGESTQPLGRLTVSIGVASFPTEARSRDLLLRRADLALYEAKRRGRDQAVTWTESIPQKTGTTIDVSSDTPLEDEKR